MNENCVFGTLYVHYTEMIMCPSMLLSELSIHISLTLACTRNCIGNYIAHPFLELIQLTTIGGLSKSSMV